MGLSLVFPGQGSQAVGMGCALADDFEVARDVFAEVDDALGEKLSQLIFEGPKEELSLTTNTQPALMATSLAAFRVLEKEAGLSLDNVASVAGHSLGEYSALCAIGAISLPDTARLLRLRGEAMQAAVPVGEGAMAAVLGLDMAAIEKACAELAGKGICEIANDNAPGQIVVSGSAAAIEAMIASAKNLGAKRALALPVSAPFHCSLMGPAAEKMRAALAQTKINQPQAKLFANITAAPVNSPDEIRDLLVNQVTGRVRWRESIAAMAAEGSDHFVEIGSGKVLAGLIKRIAPEAKTLSVGAPDTVEAFKTFL